jgi:hypothetical protein
MMDEDLAFTVEVWTERGNIERLLARSAGMLVGRGAFDAAVQQYPDREITLRHGARVIAEHNGRKCADDSRSDTHGGS